ncbi:MAG TPA: hypothetical protein VIJ72_01980 [Rhizomicrobium sp.]
MLRFSLWESGKLIAGLLGLLLLAAALGVHEVQGAGPFFLALLHQLLGFARGDFGTGAMSGAPAAAELAAAGPSSLFLLGIGGALALLLGMPLGLLVGATPLRRVAPLAHILTPMPVFCAALALAWIAFALLHVPATAKPLLALAVITAAGTFTVQNNLRRALAALRTAPFRAGLKQMGLGGWEIGRVYAAPPVLALFLARLGEVWLSLVSALCICEWLFGLPGAGLLLVKSIALQDWNIAALALLLFASLTLLIIFLGRLMAHALIGEAP